MDKLNFEFFDFFGATLPGIPVFIILSFLISYTPFSYGEVQIFLKSSSASESIVIIFVCYSLGFCLHYPAYELFQYLVKLWGIKRTKGLDISISKRENELAKIRQKTPENFKLINKFLALRQMAYSMMFSLLIFIIGLLILTICKKNWALSFFETSFLALLFAFLFLRRAVAFHQLIQEMITESYNLNN